MAVDSRRSTAAQFFDDDQRDRLPESGEGKRVISTYDRVVELLNEASLMQKDTKKLINLRQVQELVVNKEPNLMDNFLDEILAFQNDPSPDIKKFIIGFMDEACRKDPELLIKVIGNLNMLLQDENVNVRKKVILTMSSFYRTCLQWIVKSKSVNDLMIQAWKYICSMRDSMLILLDSENDGVRTHTVKFIETLVITQSSRHPDSEIPKKQEDLITLDQIPEKNSNVSYKKMQDEGLKALDSLLSFMASSHITSVNLITVMGALTNIAKQRPQFMSKVIQAFEAVHVNLPPTLAKSQVSSVRKNLKMQLLQLLKHVGSYEYQTSITTLLTDLGATNAEVMKNLPKIDESRKRKAADQAASVDKKPKLDEPEDDDERDDPLPINSTSWRDTKSKAVKKTTGMDVTIQDIIPNLTPVNVTDLVLVTMTLLPDVMPAQFSSTYTPIAAAGTDAQMQHMARLLAAQLHSAGLGKGYEMEKQESQGLVGYEEEQEEEQPEQSIRTVLRGKAQQEKLAPLEPEITASITLSQRKGLKPFKLSHVTKPMSTPMIKKLAFDAFRRIIEADRVTTGGKAQEVRVKLLAVLAAQNEKAFGEELEAHIFQDLRNRAELAFAWVYQEYANCQGYVVSSNEEEGGNLERYDECLTRLLTGLLNKPDSREGLFTRLLLEAPYITPNAVVVLRMYCQDPTRIYLGMETLKELILKRPNRKFELLQVLLDFAASERSDVRTNSMRVIRSLYERADMRGYIDAAAKQLIGQVVLPAPPPNVCNLRPNESQTQWTEETIKASIYLYVSLLPVKHDMIHQLAEIYTTSSADVKRAILRILEAPVKGMGMDSPQLLAFVEACPKGAETLVTRVIHILTDKVVPSEDLVRRVMDLFNKRVSDVRFLIPVLAGLPKQRVISVLPKLIKLNPNVVKEVFNRLLGVHMDSTTHNCPLTPAELLVALHNVSTVDADMKTIIKATTLCFAEKSVYNTEVLAEVMSRLVEISPLPTLLMRTVIQSLTMYPKMQDFVMKILTRLIAKQVWRYEKVWEGFIKCCQRTTPRSYFVLLQLPALQLLQVFDACPGLREPLRRYVDNLPPGGKSSLPQAVVNALELDPNNPIHQEALQAIRSYTTAPPPGVDMNEDDVRTNGADKLSKMDLS